MVTAIILLTVRKNLINEVAEEIAEIKEISEVYVITGQRDLAAILRASDNDTLVNVITTKVLKVEGIVESETMFAFKVYSRHDLEAIFTGSL